MKFKATNVCERQVTEHLPDVLRFSLQPGDSVMIEDVGENKAETIVHMIKAMRGPAGQRDLEFTEILEDEKIVEEIKKAEEEKEEFIPVEVEEDEVEEQPSLFSLLEKKE